MRPVANPLIAALDTDDANRFVHLASALGPHVGLLKLGLQGFTANGRSWVEFAMQHARVFLDLKLHDIPNTVAGAATVAGRLGVDMLTVHASGGPAMVAAAVKAAPATTILAVTVLTSLDDDDLALLGHPPAAQQVPRLAALAVEAGAGGVVCAPTDIAAVRAVIGDEPFVVTPGVRPAGAALDDQARVATPAEALAAGASHLVLGRPLTRADDPAAAARAILEELSR